MTYFTNWDRLNSHRDTMIEPHEIHKLKSTLGKLMGALRMRLTTEQKKEVVSHIKRHLTKAQNKYLTRCRKQQRKHHKKHKQQCRMAILNITMPIIAFMEDELKDGQFNNVFLHAQLERRLEMLHRIAYTTFEEYNNENTDNTELLPANQDGKMIIMPWTVTSKESKTENAT